MFATALLLSNLLRTCAPNIGAKTMTAIVRVESDGDPMAIHDNTIDRSFRPVDLVEAIAWSKQLIALHHSVDLGLAQLNSANLPRLGFTIRDAFDPCANLRGGATILQADYRDAATKFGPGQFALRRALGAYNTGSLFAGDAYIARILTAAGIEAEGDFRVPDLAPIGAAPVEARSAASTVSVAPAMRPAPVRPVSAPRTAVARVRPRDTASDSPILVTVAHVDASERARAVAAAAGGGPPAVAASDPSAPVVLHRTGGDAWPPAVDDRPIIVAPKASQP